MNETTILYYTSNKEDETFERNIQAILKKNSNGMPIISISQKPIGFGDNICIGQVGANDHNLYHQILIGCRAAKTPFVIMAEADNLYPPDYFNFTTDRIDMVYRYEPIYVMKLHRSYFFRKPTCEGAQITGREYLIDLIEKEIGIDPGWSDTQFKVNPYKSLNRKWQVFGSDIPVVSIKTGRGLRANTMTDKTGIRELPYWGTTRTVRRKLA
jgi:hypothetical protein